MDSDRIADKTAPPWHRGHSSAASYQADIPIPRALARSFVFAEGLFNSPIARHCPCRKSIGPGGSRGLQIRWRALGVLGRFDSCLFRITTVRCRPRPSENSPELPKNTDS